MATQIRRAGYFTFDVDDKAGEGARVLGILLAGLSALSGAAASIDYVATMAGENNAMTHWSEYIPHVALISLGVIQLALNSFVVYWLVRHGEYFGRQGESA